jgi:CheY-like chemotaxis protein
VTINVLYVEDDPTSRDVLRMVDRMNPDLMSLCIFDDSQDFEARLAALSHQPDLILLDIHMKPYTGFEVLEMIRKEPTYDAVPVVAVTASVMNEEVQAMREAGFDGIIAKPLDIEDVPAKFTQFMDGDQLWYV